MEYITENSSQTIALGRKMGKNLEGRVFALQGELGGGKTTFVKGFLEGLQGKGEVLSPTFIIFRKFSLPKKKFLFHFDCYRIEDKEELISLGFEEIIKNRNNIVIIEWPEIIEELLPKERVSVNFQAIGENKRKIDVWTN